MVLSIFTLLPSAARTAGTANGTPIELEHDVKALGFFLNVTDCKTDAGDTLDVKVQHSPDKGTTWDDLVHFTQVLGDDADNVYKEMAFVHTDITNEDEIREPSVALAAGNVIQGPVFPYLRATSTIVDADADGAFTFGVTMQILR